MLCKSCGSRELLKLSDFEYQCQRCFTKQLIIEEKEEVIEEIVPNIEEETISVNASVSDDFFTTIDASIVKLKSSGGFGTGFFIDDEGHLITNAHVVGSDTIVQGYLGVSPILLEFEVVAHGESMGLDLALLKLISDTEFISLSLAPNRPKLAATIFVIGNPNNLGISVSKGSLSRISEKEYQLDVTVNPGNSGGPVLNEHGEVVGVVSYLINEVQGLGFAVSMDALESFLKLSIKSKEEE